MLTIAILILAQSAAEPSVWTFGQIGFNFIVGLGMLWIGHKTKRIETLETEIKTATKTLIDAQLEVVVAKFTGAVESLKLAVHQINDRLGTGDGKFENLGKRDQNNELKLMACMNEIKDYIRDHCAAKEDVQKLSQEVIAMKVELARQGE